MKNLGPVSDGTMHYAGINFSNSKNKSQEKIMSIRKRYLTSLRSVIETEVSKYPEPKVSIASDFVSLLLKRAGVALVRDGN